MKITTLPKFQTKLLLFQNRTVRRPYWYATASGWSEVENARVPKKHLDHSRLKITPYTKDYTKTMSISSRFHRYRSELPIVMYQLAVSPVAKQLYSIKLVREAREVKNKQCMIEQHFYVSS